MGIEGRLGTVGKLGMVGSGGSEPGLGSAGWVVGKVGIVGSGSVGIDGNPVLGKFGILGKGDNCLKATSRLSNIKAGKC